MFRQIVIHAVLCVLFISISSVSRAGNVPGYIITNTNDTVYGEVDAFRHNLYPGALVIAGIDLESYYHSVSFKSETDKRAKTYTSEDILGFAFTVKSIEYQFRRFKIESNSIAHNERERYCFLNLLLSSELKLYRFAERKQNDTSHDFYKDQTSVYYDLYLYSDKKGLRRVLKSKEMKTLIELLRFYEVDEAFLETLPRRTKFKYVKDVLIDYEKWKRDNYMTT